MRAAIIAAMMIAAGPALADCERPDEPLTAMPDDWQQYTDPDRVTLGADAIGYVADLYADLIADAALTDPVIVIMCTYGGERRDLDGTVLETWGPRIGMGGDMRSTHDAQFISEVAGIPIAFALEVPGVPAMRYHLVLEDGILVNHPTE